MPDGNTVTVAISGGLGNQMFKYAAARALALRHGGDVGLDVTFYRNSRHRHFELDAFPIIAKRLVPASGGFWKRFGAKSREPEARARVYREPHFRFDPAFLDLALPVVLDGYFQSPRYFESSAEAIRRELTPPPARDSESLAIARAMTERDSAAVHVRRGDYVSKAHVNAIHGTCSIAYYQRAIEQLPGDSTVFVFSDDIAWARANLPAVRRLVFVGDAGPRPGLADLWLMTLAQHHIVANSSFSWWGAWLAAPGNGRKFAPARWFADASLDDRDLVPADWTRVPS
ncbi:MAG: fucT2 [Devosia sp.]|uniref:alpha-1,2-fucosyltransferase n=1 Tax=Devosia sp. TaxID=1871048 RepID=UPI0026377496|nr:alpha-1,2-fucosyltransferase [Devosia sp.]MDB5540638.1 fucT2 [Devosia sp.]